MFGEGWSGVILSLITLIIVLLIFGEGDSPMAWWQYIGGVLIFLIIVIGLIHAIDTVGIKRSRGKK